MSIPDQTGRLALVTGANSGIGLATVRLLAGAGASVILACRDSDRATAAMHRIRLSLRTAQLEPLSIDLSDLASVRDAAEHFSSKHTQLDLLVNNAGVCGVRDGGTAQGLESHFGINHLGHFALTGLLLPRLLETPSPRVVTVTSNAHRTGVLRLDELGASEPQEPDAAYARSKLANVMFALELQRRAHSAGTRLTSIAAHPGNARTNLGRHAPRPAFPRDPMRRWVDRTVNTQSAEMGALPLAFAATESVPPAAVVGPRGPGQMRGYPGLHRYSERARDPDKARRLWEMSEAMAGIQYDWDCRSAVSRQCSYAQRGRL